MISFVTSVTGYIYRFLCLVFIEKANYKYLKQRNSAFMLSMLLFRFINVNLAIIYIILDETIISDFNEGAR